MIVSPNGPTMTTVLSHPSTTELLPHHSTAPGPRLPPRVRSPSSSLTSGVIENSDKERAKSDEVTQRSGSSAAVAEDALEVEFAGETVSRARNRPLGEGVMERYGPRVRRCCE